METYAGLSGGQPVLAVDSVLKLSLAVLLKKWGLFFGLTLAWALPPVFAKLNLTLRPNLMNFGLWLAACIFGLIVFSAVILAAHQSLGDDEINLRALFLQTLSRSISFVLLSAYLMLCLTICFLCFVLPGLILTGAWAVALQACLLEGKGLSEATARSEYLTRGHRVRALALVITLVLAGLLVSGVLHRPLNLVVSLTGIPGPLSGAVSDLLLAAPMATVGGVMTTVVHHRLKSAKEGLTRLSDLAKVFD